MVAAWSVGLRRDGKEPQLGLKQSQHRYEEGRRVVAAWSVGLKRDRE